MSISVEAFTPSKFTAQGCIRVRGQEVPYTVTSEDNLLYNDEGKAVGSIFSYSYVRSDVENPEPRPVIFVFNGGPGSSCIWLHVGMFGAQRIKLDDPEAVNVPTVAPFAIEDNPYSLLDVADIVCIDPVGTGYGRLLDKEYAKEFYAVEADAEAIAHFIEGWLSRNKRWNSPHYLAGESYGTTRAAVIAGIMSSESKARTFGVAIDGLILMGNTVSPGRGMFNSPVEHSVIILPTLAATHWYHNHPVKYSVEQFVEEAYEFAGTEYLTGLFAGDSLKGKKREQLIKKLMHFTGMKREYLEEHFLRIDMMDFMHLVCKDKGLSVGFYDGRYTLPNPTGRIGQYEVVADDPALGVYPAAFVGAFHDGFKEKLNITFDRHYYVMSGDVNTTWDRQNKHRTTAEYLSSAMRRNPKMKVMFANGYYDLCTIMGNVRYTVNQIGMDPDRTFVREYPSGHMPYLGDVSTSMMTEDIRKLMLGL